MYENHQEVKEQLESALEAVEGYQRANYDWRYVRERLIFLKRRLEFIVNDFRLLEMEVKREIEAEVEVSAER